MKYELDEWRRKKALKEKARLELLKGGKLVDPEPPRPGVLEEGASDEEYKAFMIRKYNHEQWENRQLLKMRKSQKQ